MPNSDNNKKFNFRFVISGLLVFCGSILFYYILFHFDNMKERIGNFTSIFTPLFSGIGIAYILNPVMRFLEKKVLFPLWDRIKRRKDHTYSKEAVVIRIISVIMTILIFLALIYGIIMSVVPQILNNIGDIINKIPNLDYSALMQNLLPDTQILEDFSNISENLINNVGSILTSIQPILSGLLKTTTTIIDYASPVFKSLLNFLIGIIISVYLLFDKEKYIAQSKKLLYAFLKRETANNLINNLRYSDKIFGGFITGKVVDSLIIGVLCYFGVLIIGTNVPVLIAVVIGVTNIIPYFGPFIGAIPCGLIILMYDPKKCLIFLIFILILQQFDGNILGPKILGSSIGLNGFWVIFAITVFSKMLGVIGIFLGVPLFAVIYSAIRTLINKRLEIKHMPVETDYYKKSDYIPEEDDVNNSGQLFRFGQKTFDRVKKQTDEEDKNRVTALTNSFKKKESSEEISKEDDTPADNKE